MVYKPLFAKSIVKNQDLIHTWLKQQELSKELPLYSSVDIRNSGFKMAVVDTNLFPAGFNNLCEHGIADSVGLMKQAVLKRVPNCQNILIIAEEHTRNTWYLENIRILEEIIRKAGFNVKIATFLTIQPGFCEDVNHVVLKTATGQEVNIYCFKNILNKFQQNQEKFDLIIMNNDLTTGIPDVLKNSQIPIYPSLMAGWHSRLKSHHFDHTRDVLKELGKLIDLDPWLLSCLHTTIADVDINQEEDRVKIQDLAADLLKKIAKKYQKHAIQEKPYLVLKSDSGTYGMGVMTLEDPAEILHLNRKEKNKLHIGKGAQVIDRFLLQEGVPTIYTVKNRVSEVCMYQIENHLVGGFFRFHAEKTDRENLNSKGMGFKKICPRIEKYADCEVHPDLNTYNIYKILARIAGIAAHREIVQLERIN